METTPKVEGQKGFTKRQWILLLFCGVIDLFIAMTMSLQAPFYPAEAERKGATASEYGFIFGIHQCLVFLAAPVFGKYMNKLGPKRVFIASILTTSVAVICFGLLHWLDDRIWFIALGFICRIFEGLGCAGFFTSTFVIIAFEFPQAVATTFATLETFIGIGFIVGPTFGGALYDLGGFPLPFFTVGAGLLITGLISFFIIPVTETATNADGSEQKGYGIWTILKIPSVALAALSICSASMSLGVVSATLEPHIRKFGLTPVLTGLVFIANGGMYAVSAPLVGYICDRIERPLFITVLGNLLIFISFLLIGPASFIPFDTILWVTIVGLVIQGLGFGCCFVSSFMVGLQDSMKNGLPDNMATYAVASGLWESMSSLGAWIGPSVGGVLYDTVGFREGSWLILIISFISGISIVMYIFMCPFSYSSSKSDKNEETKPLVTGDLEASGAAGPSTNYGST